MSTHPEKAEKTKRRSDMACTSCRSRKLKAGPHRLCENKDSTPPCKRCERDKINCEFKPVAEDHTPTRNNSKTPTSSPEDHRVNHPPVPVSPTQATPQTHIENGLNGRHLPAPSPRTIPSQSSPEFFYSPQPVSQTVPTPRLEGPGFTNGVGYPSQNYRDNTSQWQGSGSIVYDVSNNYTTPILAQNPPYGPYSPSNNSYTQPLYGPDQQPRATPRSSYFYAPNQQPSGLVTYPDTNAPNGPPFDNNHFYGQ
ncbi:hypothetical protein P691DRAFT_772274 [Macrolepiota fuliginosa MF-IS2]|uniref:Zn(2)-C6 fungal-type domain-containing protein n=1 Tax=Macrolepiota fuliginosa MF-IS2 TaxID=1400762 RepID=A0A9P5XMV5_9AGAR|nr:hypothetical protein P691DRAFT_772274 [Macrolepiota fuliginosa MF-IS2]